MHKNRTLKTLTRFKKAIKACFGPMHDRKSIEINLLTLSTLLTSHGCRRNSGQAQ